MTKEDLKAPDLLVIARSATSKEVLKPPFRISSSLRGAQRRSNPGRMKRNFQPAVYIMANRRNGALYTGVTSGLPKRTWEHREGVADGFSKRYGCKLLVWYEVHSTMEYAIARETQIKGGSRKRKLALIEANNPHWKDLFAEVCA